ncbi:cytochrome c oxidase assembly protein [Zavarzinia sp. CC-PAN008]|uniref:cytochrome c oxidase assembly protein n=1 Tax=Zavarzinia sp. CC-PAN008 TaxID=3243332 RepID=UPI003F747E6A
MNRHTRLGLIVGAVPVLMLGLAYASVPLYELFCRVTGFAGTPVRAALAPGAVGDRKITVRFDANTDPGLPWRFHAEQATMTVAVGEDRLAFYKAENLTDGPVMGRATYNVVPEKASPYFAKIACFCFDEQTLQANQSVDMPVSFFIDPAINDDPNLDGLTTVTLSYTFFRATDDPALKAAGQKAAAASPAAVN